MFAIIISSIIQRKYPFSVSLGIIVLVSVIIIPYNMVAAQTLDALTNQTKISGLDIPAIKVGDYPTDIEVNPDTNTVYVANQIQSM